MVSGDELSSPPFFHDSITNPNPNSAKRKRNLPGNPDPDAEVIALSPESLMATNRFVCEICSKGFQRDQNLQLHRRGHNLPWKLKQRNKQEVARKKVYICPEINCVHHDPSRALGDLTGVKKHFSRKHGEKKWKCERCLKKYAVHSDWKAHSKICGTREYRCDCGTIFSRKDSFTTHRAFCDALTEDHSIMASFSMPTGTNIHFQNDLMLMNSDGMMGMKPIWLHHRDNNPVHENDSSSSFFGPSSLMNNNNSNIGGMLSSEMVQWLSRNQETTENFLDLPQGLLSLKEEDDNTKGDIQLNPMYNGYGGCPYPPPPPPHMSATALLQKASQIASTRSTNSDGFGLMNTSELSAVFNSLTRSENLMMSGLTRKTTREPVDSGEGSLTRDFLGVEGHERREVGLQQELVKVNSLFDH
ncbi:hypothetical protein R6Q59_008549 [Mikania micrantha]|uniref:C2H2-type domain-containing protein n=1 Tax=Mikania micrantha TaxID=192012 RepID=A0A5N6Q7G3_9ASTR|nr:hypothetical protein E3N88_02863 [Mikania micrantha]